jgi:ABC-type lipoprotein export system ATPase subunit
LSTKITEIQQLINARNSLMNKKELFDKIISVYNTETAVKEKDFEKQKLEIAPFTFSYNEEFTLKNEKTLVFEKGKMTLLKGPSGSGKSTLLGIISGSILTESNTKYKTVYFSSDRTLGSKNLLREITFENEISKVDRTRLINILKGVCLFDEVIKKADGEDILVYLSHTYKENLSTGLDQRVMLARTLYRLDDGNIVIIDEPVGALDQETAIKVLDFIKQYACKDKLLIITTHQYYIYGGFDEVVELVKKGRETKIN